MADTTVERPQKPVAESSDYLRLVAARQKKDEQKASEVLQEIETRRKADV